MLVWKVNIIIQFEVITIDTIYILVCALCACSTNKVIGVITKSRKEHTIAQAREFSCTKDLLPQVIATGKSMLITAVLYIHNFYTMTIFFVCAALLLFSPPLIKKEKKSL